MEKEVDGVSLSQFTPGLVREVSASIGSWLIAEGYAQPEMRAPANIDEMSSLYGRPRQFPATAHDHRRRKGDR